MNIQTKYLGDVVIDKGKIIQFQSGIPGFVEEKGFVLINIPGNPMFQFLQSVTTKSLAFVVTSPYHFYNEYVFELDNSIIETLEINREEDVLVASIVTLKDPFESSTINLKAPIIINQKKMLGKQYILNSEEYESKVTIKSTTAGKGV